ncbi:MAG: hypothetical protein KBT02_13550 [Treponema sp.]|nr:hypothetical protein [Candidatus Treponema caballi]
MKKLTVRFYTFFAICCYFGSLFLRFYAMCYFYRTPEDFFPNIGPTLIATTGLLFLFSFLICPPLIKFDQTIQKVSQGAQITEEERRKALNTYNREVIFIIIANVTGFVIGQITVMSMDFKNGVVPYTFERALLIVIQAVLIGFVLALYEIYFLNTMMMTPRKLLNITSLEGFGKNNNGKSRITVTRKIILVFIATLCLMGVNMLSAPFYLALDNSFTEQERLNLYMRFGSGGFLTTFAFCIGLVFIITRELKHRINSTSSLINNLGKKGELSSRINLDMNDDMSELSANMNFFMDRLSETINGLHNQTVRVTEVAKELDETVITAANANSAMIESVEKIQNETNNQMKLIDEAKDKAKELMESATIVSTQVGLQSEALQKSSSSVNQIAENIDSVAGMTKRADELSTTLESVAAEGGKSLTSATTAILDLQKASEEVQSIVTVIQSIAAQTNLLAMNAAIEAAHAGESGKGFAVVADEVRKLASSSSKSADDIKNHISNIMDKINIGVDSINRAEKAFRSINEDISESSELMQTINGIMDRQRQEAHATLSATNSVVDANNIIQDLARKQNSSSETMQAIISDIVESSKNVNEAITENTDNSSNMNTAITNVSHNCEDNRKAVHAMEEAISAFHD